MSKWEIYKLGKIAEKIGDGLQRIPKYADDAFNIFDKTLISKKTLSLCHFLTNRFLENPINETKLVTLWIAGKFITANGTVREFVPQAVIVALQQMNKNNFKNSL